MGQVEQRGMMTRLSRPMRLFMIAIVLAFAAARPAAAQSVLRDSETEKLFRDISKPLIIAAGLDPKSTSVVLLHDQEINAFVAGGQIVYIQSGLLTSSDNVNQLQGVIAHELGHVAGGHIIRMGDGIKKATGISILSLVAGALAMAVGAPADVGMGLMAAGQQAAMGSFLSFPRAHESSAELAGA
jgi:predicted Zn-dependent protease